MSTTTATPVTNQQSQSGQTSQQGQTPAGLQQQSSASSSSSKVGGEVAGGGGGGGGGNGVTGQSVQKPIELDKIYQWINELCMPATRENALIELR